MNIAHPITITEIVCESDDGTGSPTIQLMKNGGTSDICNADITCGTTPTKCTGASSINTANDNIAVDDEIDFTLETVSAGLRRLNVCFMWTID